MLPPPKGKPSHGRGAPDAETATGAGARGRGPDRTTAAVAAGMVVLAVLGVITVFSGPLLALVAPPPAGDPAGAAPAAASAPAAVTPLGRADGGTHS